MTREPETATPAPRWGLVIVEGVSMQPTLRPHDRLLVDSRRPVRAGDVVVARFPDGTVVVKRATELTARGWWLSSDNEDEGIDSRHRGAVKVENILAVAVARVWPSPWWMGRHR